MDGEGNSALRDESRAAEVVSSTDGGNGSDTDTDVEDGIDYDETWEYESVEPTVSRQPRDVGSSNPSTWNHSSSSNGNGIAVQDGGLRSEEDEGTNSSALSLADSDSSFWEYPSEFDRSDDSSEESQNVDGENHVGQNDSLELQENGVGSQGIDGVVHENGNRDAKYLDPGSVVWVKMQKLRWPCVIQDPKACPQDLMLGSRRKPVAIVRFFNEDKYELIMSEERIWPYNHPEKLDFIMKSLRSLQGELLKKYRHDVEESEMIAGAEKSAKIWETVAAKEKEAETSKQSLKAAFAEDFDPNLKQHKMQFFGHNVHRRPTQESELERVREEVKGDKEYKCQWCKFVTTRVNNVIAHFKIHTPNAPKFLPHSSAVAYHKDSSSMKSKWRKYKQLEAKCTLGVDSEVKQKLKRELANGMDGPTQRKRRKKKKEDAKEGSVAKAADLVADWDEFDDDEDSKEDYPDEEKKLIEKRQSLQKQQEQQDLVFNALIESSSEPKPRFSNFRPKFTLPAPIEGEETDEVETEAPEDAATPSSNFNSYEDEPEPESDEEASGAKAASNGGKQPEEKEEEPGSEDGDGNLIEEGNQPAAVVSYVEEIDSTSTSAIFQEVHSTSGEIHSTSGEPGDVMESISVSAEAEAALATVELPQGSVLTSPRQALVVARRDPETNSPKYILVTTDESGNVESISPLDDMDMDQRQALEIQMQLENGGDLSAHVAELNSVEVADMVLVDDSHSSSNLDRHPAPGVE